MYESELNIMGLATGAEVLRGASGSSPLDRLLPSVVANVSTESDLSED